MLMYESISDHNERRVLFALGLPFDVAGAGVLANTLDPAAPRNDGRQSTHRYSSAFGGLGSRAENDLPANVYWISQFVSQFGSTQWNPATSQQTTSEIAKQHATDKISGSSASEQLVAT